MGWLSDANKKRKDVTRGVADTLTGGLYGEASDVLTGVAGSITGQDAADAAKRAGKSQAKAAVDAADLQYKGAQEALAQGKELSAPYRQLGEQNIGQFQNLVSDPMQYLQNNPMFNAAVAGSSEQIKNLQSLSGKAGSGGTVNQLFQNYLAQGNEQINQQYNRLLRPVQMGQAAAAGQAAQGANLITGGANALAAGQIGQANALASGQIGAANAQQQGVQNALGLGALFFSDRRLKENIEAVGRGDRGLPLYKFNYIGENDTYLGYMADEIQKLDPNQVFLDKSGFYKVGEKYAPVRLN